MTQIKSHIPKIRFKEFSSEWEENIFGSVAKFSKGKGISKDNIVENGDLECIRYGELYTTYGETIKNIKSKTNLNKKDLVLSEYNDIIIPASGETQIDIATASCVLKDGVALGGDLNIIKTKNNGIFLSYYLNNRKKIDIARLSQGISVVHLYSSQLQTLKLNLPSLPEQQKIASFLSLVDEKIEKIKEKNKNLEEYKKGVMQKIFSQELRFKDDNGKEFGQWEEKKLGEVCEKQSSNISANTLENNTGNYKIYGATGFLKYIDFYQEENDYISIVKDGAGVGRVLYCEGKSSVLGTLDKIKPKKGTNLNFLLSVLSNIDFTKYTIGSTIPHIYFKDYGKEKILFPTLKEQEKIADFLSGIDEKIEKVSDELGKMEEFKKGLLQGMFV